MLFIGNKLACFVELQNTEQFLEKYTQDLFGSGTFYFVDFIINKLMSITCNICIYLEQVVSLGS